MISEIFFDPVGADDQLQWVELYNAGTTSITLTGNYSLGFGRNDYTRTVIDLIGTIGAGQTFIVGGDLSDPLNFSPILDQAVDFDPDIRRGENNNWADGVALFTGPAIGIVQGSDPIDTVIYGEATASARPWLTDGSGANGSGSVDVVLPTSGIAGQSISFDGTSWAIQTTPTPFVSNIPEPDTAVMLAIGLLGLATFGRKPKDLSGKPGKDSRKGKGPVS